MISHIQSSTVNYGRATIARVTKQLFIRPFIALLAVTLAILGAVALPGGTALAEQSANQCIGYAHNFHWQDGKNIREKEGVKRFIGVSRTIATVGFDWSVPTNAKAGDSFYLTLPQELEVETNIQRFELRSPDGEVVANARVVDTRKVAFTFTSYVDTHGNVSGKGFFSVMWTDKVNGSAITPGDYDLKFTSCGRDAETLKATLLPEPKPGFWQEGAKNGVVSIDEGANNVYWWIGMDSNYQDSKNGSAGRSYAPDTKPLVISDPGGEGYRLTCEGLRIWNRTPVEAIRDGRVRDTGPETKVDPNRYSCEPLGERGIKITFKPQKSLTGGPDWYVDGGETLEVLVKGILDPSYKDLDALENTATITNMPGTWITSEGELDDKRGDRKLHGTAEIPGAGGTGQGERVGFKITKAVAGQGIPADAEYTFSYKCSGDSFSQLPSIKSGQTTRPAYTKAGISCTIREDNITPGVKVAYKLLNPAAGDSLIDNHDGTMTLTLAKGRSLAEVEILATNTYTAVPRFQVKKTTQDKPVVVTPGTTQLDRSYTVTVSNVGNKSGTSPQVLDTPAAPEGFEITKVSVDGKAIPKDQASGKYVVTSGVFLEAQSSQAYSVVVSYSVKPNSITSESLEKLGQCKTGENPDPSLGIFNQVEMKDDADGPANNNACTTGTMRAEITWEKVAPDHKTHLAGAVFRLYGYQVQIPGIAPGGYVEIADCVEDGKCGTGPFADKDPRPGYFKVANLPIVEYPWPEGQTQGIGYYLREQKAPQGYEANEPRANLFFPGVRFGNMSPLLLPKVSKANGRVTVTQSGQVVNYPKNGEVIWNKTDEGRNLLGGSEWTIRGEKLEKPLVIKDCVAATPQECEAQAGGSQYYDRDNAAGSFLVKLPLGSYTLEETKAPAGFIKSDEIYAFTVVEGEITQVNNGNPIVNHRLEVPKLPLTGGLGADQFLIGGAVLGALALGCEAVRRKRTRTRNA